MNNPVLAAALEYAAAGIPVFPVRPDKRPYKGTAGFKDATCDPDQINAWWQTHPEAMIGTPCGEKSDLFVVDLDNKPDRNGLAAWKRLKIDDHAPEVRTPSGGIHRYYHFGDCGLRNTQSKIGPGIDTRGAGGYVVLPPSRTGDGGCYQWTNGQDYRDRVEIPPELLARLRSDPDLDALLEACERIRKTTEGERNGVLNSEAFQIAKQGKVDPSVARKALREAALDCGLDPREIEATLNSAFSSGERESQKRKKKSAAHAIELRSIEPWPHPVAGDRLLADIKQAIKRHVVMTDDQARAVALWVVHAHCIGFVRLSPRLSISGPTKRTGKSTLLSVIEELVPKPLATSNITMAAMFRIVDLEQPTVLIDEIDSFITARDAPAGREMRGLLNEGYTARGRYHRTAGDDHTVTAFNVYAATVLAGIGRLPDTVADRSITIQLQRKLPSETVERLEFGNTGHLEQLASQAARWAADNGERLKTLRPALPESPERSPARQLEAAAADRRSRVATIPGGGAEGSRSAV